MTSDSRPIAGIEPDAVSRWLADNVEGFAGPARFDLIAGGRSNLTYLVTDANGMRMALRRPPTGSVLESAHDMGREWKFISALQGTGVPVSTPLAFCTDHAVTGADFYVMSFVDGVVMGDADDAQQLSEDARAHASIQVADVLARLHSLDVNQLDVPGSRKTTGYIPRQVERWTAQVQAVMPPETEQVVRIAQRLVDDVPAQVTGIAHGDYRVGNLSFDKDGNILAIFDWELATVGDCMADLGWLMSTWAEPGESAFAATTHTPTQAGGFLSRAEVAERYAAQSGNDISCLDYYVAFQRWRGACIQLGVRHRYQVGAMGDDGYDHSVLDATISGALDAAEADLRS